jgi:sugar transferase EpsL
MKRALDLGAVLITLPLWLTLLAAIALLVRLTLGRPVFFRQKRLGRGALIFELIKFRTMRDGKDALGNLLPDAERLTPFGRWLRASSLDELPQLWNVLKGDMSLVGPRPLLVDYLTRYNARQSRRHEVRPGVTGLAQVSGRNTLSWEERFELDIRYVETRTLSLDLKILGRTLKAVAFREGISASGESTMPEFRPQPDRTSPHG